MSTSGITQQISWEFLMPQRKPHIRVAGYPRVSDENIKLESGTIESQAKAIRKYIDEHPEMFLVEMKPEAMTGYMKPFKERKVFMEIMDMARRGMLDGVVVTEFSRLSRRQGEQAVIVELLRSYNVTVYSCTESFDDSALGQFMRAAAAFSAESEREKVVYRTTRGMLDRIEAGNLSGRGKPAYGYRFADTDKYHKAVYVIYEPEAEIVRFIFEKADGGWPHRRIARELTQQNVPTMRMTHGKSTREAWSNSSVGNILSNPYYAGRGTALRYKKGEKNHSEYIGGEGLVKLPEGVVPAIVSEEVFDRVQVRMQQNYTYSPRNNKYPERGLMRGLSRCGICGSCLQLQHRFRHGGLESTYRCRKNEGREEQLYHHSVSTHINQVDDYVWQKAVAYIRHPSYMRNHIESLCSQNRQLVDVENVARLLAECKRKYLRLFDLAEAATDDDTYNELKARLLPIEQEKRTLEVSSQ